MSEQSCSAGRDGSAFMERNLAAVWTCLLGAGFFLVLPPAFSITTATPALRPPRLIDCVFQHRANVTCRWESGDPPATHYTLKVKLKPAIAAATNSPLSTFTCTTSENSCTVITNSNVRISYCITITAHHSHSGNISSERPCQSGRFEVMLPPVPLKSVTPVEGRPHCLNVTWTRILADFPVSAKEIRDGKLKSQIEATEQGQFNSQVENVNVTGNSFLVCLFRPYTSYNIRLRHSLVLGPESPWSPWSNACPGRTGEDAPSAAPAFWRRVEQTFKNGSRLISLLWKPLPPFQANGRVLFFNVTCQTKSAQVIDHGSCRDLHDASTSCSLRLPAGRCSCSLTASTSGGTSPEAIIWLLGAYETEPPPPSQINVSALNDSSFDVRWTAPVDQPTRGFVVQWFAVREKNSSILHWERVNSSCTALVITEGVKPMERYAVSVRALFGERGAGQNKTVHIYTSQGVPSDGPKVHVQQISGRSAELVWIPVPVERLHGFIRSYKVSYSIANQPNRSVLVPGHAHSYSLKNLLPGNYDIFMQANTDAGAGACGPIAKVFISEGSEEISIVMYALLPIMLTSLVLVLMVCLSQSKMVKKKLCQDVPDPSNSSLAQWTPKSALESMKRPAIAEKAEIKYSQVILLGESEPQNPDKDLKYQSICSLQSYSSQCCSPLQVLLTQTPQNGGESKRYIKSLTRANLSSNAELSSSSSIYSNVLLSQTPESLPVPLLFPAYLQSNDWQHGTVSVNDVKSQLDGDSEPFMFLQGRSNTMCGSSASLTAELKTLHLFLRRHQSPVSLSNLRSDSHSSMLPSHPPAVTSIQNLFSESLYSSLPSLQPNGPTLAVGLSESFSTSLSPFPLSIFVDPSYCPLQCDPSVSPGV